MKVQENYVSTPWFFTFFPRFVLLAIFTHTIRARADLQRRMAALEAQSAVDAEQTAAQFHSAQTSFAAQV
jgi:hypothetical protein